MLRAERTSPCRRSAHFREPAHAISYPRLTTHSEHGQMFLDPHKRRRIESWQILQQKPLDRCEVEFGKRQLLKWWRGTNDVLLSRRSHCAFRLPDGLLDVGPLRKYAEVIR